MQVDAFDQLTTGRRVRTIRFSDGGFVQCGDGGVHVALQGDASDAQAWIGFDEQGIWLSYKAEKISRASGNLGVHGHQDPMSSVTEVIFA